MSEANTDPNKPGAETTEWKVWLFSICGVLGTALTAFLTKGLIEDGTTLAFVLGTVASLLVAVGKLSGDYIKGRALVKASANQAKAAEATARANPSRPSTGG